MIKKISLISFVLFFLAYAGMQGIHIFLGEKIKTNLVQVENYRFALSGKLPHIKDLTVNGTPISTDLDGNFMYDFSPLPGMNVVTVNATDQFKNTTQKEYSFIYNNATGSVVSLRTNK